MIARAAAWATAHPNESVAIVTKCGKLDPNLIKKMQRARSAQRFNVTAMQPMIDLAPATVLFLPIAALARGIGDRPPNARRLG